MKQHTKLLLFLFLLTLGTLGCQKEELPLQGNETASTSAQRGSEPSSGIYIVVLKDDFAAVPLSMISDYALADKIMLTQVSALIAQLGLSEASITQVYHTAIKGFAISLPVEKVALLKQLKQVELIEKDVEQRISVAAVAAAAEETPYGISRVGSASGVGKKAWIIDTGIDLDHPDLTVDVAASKSFLSFPFSLLEPGADDKNGHGTHVAGTVAAKQNGQGVVGVAFGATVVAVRVLNSAGSGNGSDVIKGIDYVAATAKAGDAVNMSLGGGASAAEDLAVQKAAAKGLFFALAAGNDSQNASTTSPARVNGVNIYTISAIDAADKFASFSNFGNPPVDFAAPGVSIKSTYMNGGYSTLSGTSMAAPHVCGLLLLTNGALATSGFAKNDPDGKADPIAHK